MSYVTYDYKCTNCGRTEPCLQERGNILKTEKCVHCGGTAVKCEVPSTLNVSTAKLSESKPAGIDKGSKAEGVRKDLLERSMLRKEARKLTREGKYKEAAKVKEESKKPARSTK